MFHDTDENAVYWYQIRVHLYILCVASIYMLNSNIQFMDFLLLIVPWILPLLRSRKAEITQAIVTVV
jgi:hypothetical protein